jgi:uncharacterized membrane protein YdjX (TVP38/TMEM64 family)
MHSESYRFSLLLALGVGLASQVAIAQAAEPETFSLLELLRDALHGVQELGAVGVVAFIGLYIIATVAFVPGSILTLGAGVLFGVVAGAVYVFVAATLGATAAFLVGRYVARDWVARQIDGHPRFKAIDEAVGRKGFTIVLLTRLSPVFPFNLLNYAFGLTRVPLRDYVLGSVGMIPGTVLYVYLGSLAGSLTVIGTEQQPADPAVQWTLRLLGFAATVAVTLYLTRIARRALAQQLDQVKPDARRP